MKSYERWGWDQQQEYEEDLKTLYSLTTDEGRENNYSEDIAKGTGLYGELTRKAVEHMMEKLRPYFSDPDGVFYDLGSGTGKVVSHVALGSQLSKVCGIELDTIRYSKSKKHVDRLSYPISKPQIINGDFLNYDFSDATIIYFDNTMWVETMKQQPDVVKKMFGSLRPGTLIVSKEIIPHVTGALTTIRLGASRSRPHGFYLIFHGIALDT